MCVKLCKDGTLPAPSWLWPSVQPHQDLGAKAWFIFCDIYIIWKIYRTRETSPGAAAGPVGPAWPSGRGDGDPFCGAASLANGFITCFFYIVMGTMYTWAYDMCIYVCMSCVAFFVNSKGYVFYMGLFKKIFSWSSYCMVWRTTYFI